MPEIIVVGVDHSKSARRAAAAARDLAVAFNADLHIITAFDSDRTEAFGSGSDRRITSQADAAETVASAVARELQNNQVEVRWFAVKGSPAQALIKHAEVYTAKMIVVGNKRMSGLGRVLGSVAAGVASGSPCDVHIVKTTGR